MSPPLTPDADQARRQLADELAKPIYADVQNWLQEQLNKLIDWLTGGLHPTGTLTSAQITGIVAAAALIAMAVLWWTLGAPRIRRRRTREVLADEQRSAEELLGDAERLAAGGDWTQAALQLYRAIVRSLSERALIEEFAGMTAHEAAALAAPRLPDLAGRMAQGADVFDALAYGHRTGTSAHYDRLRTLHADVAAARPELPAAVPVCAGVDVEAVR